MCAPSICRLSLIPAISMGAISQWGVIKKDSGRVGGKRTPPAENLVRAEPSAELTRENLEALGAAPPALTAVVARPASVASSSELSSVPEGGLRPRIAKRKPRHARKSLLAPCVQQQALLDSPHAPGAPKQRWIRHVQRCGCRPQHHWQTPPTTRDKPCQHGSAPSQRRTRSLQRCSH